METPNIILITIDSLRYDHLGCYGYPRNTSPNIDSLAARGVKFLQAISNGGNTPASFPSILLSALPPLDSSDSRAILRRSTALAELLKNAGYKTAAFHSNPHVSRFYGYGKGFDIFDDSFRQFSPKGGRLWIRTRAKSPGSLMAKVVTKVRRVLKPILYRVLPRHTINAERLTNKAMSWLDARKGKFFLWLHFTDVHHPYMPPVKYLHQFCDELLNRRQMKEACLKMLTSPNELSQSDIEMLINLYDASIKYTDDIIGSFLQEIGRRLSNTFVIITADHGEEFGEHGRFRHHALYDGLLHVPLIMAGPSLQSGMSVEQQVSSIDLSPTIVEIAGAGSPQSFRGQSLLPLMKGEGKITECTISTLLDNDLEKRQFSYRTPGWKYIRTESLNVSGLVLREEVYDLTNDPGETENLHGTDTEEVKNFEEEALDKLSQFKQLKVEESTDYEKQRIKVKLSRLKKLK